MPVENNKFFSFIYKRKVLFAVFFFIFSGIFIPLVSYAGGWVETLRKGIIKYLLYIIIKLAVNIAKFFTELAGSLLNWVLSPDFINISYTNPSGPRANTIIETGLNVTRGFANMLLVLILVYIAIATILRLAGYETKKLLVTFIFVALLVNFAPVICGVIVDASNIVMNFFVEDLKADTFGKIMSTKVESISVGFTERTEIESGWSQITQLAVMVPFLWILTLILLLFTILFILRYLVIWLLVILAPLAFIAYILPNTRKYFEQWWNQLLGWSFIGVTCGFFLYLGLLLVTKVPTVISTPTTSGDGTFNAILPFFVSIVFLGIGFTFGLKTSAAGASTVIGAVKARGRSTVRAGSKAGRWIGKKTWKGMALGDRKLVPRFRSKEERAGRKWYKPSTYIASRDITARKAAEGVSKTWDRAPVLRWFRPEPLKKFGEYKGALEDAKKGITGPSPDEMQRFANGKYSGARAAATLEQTVVDRGDSQDVVKIYAKKYDYDLNKEGSEEALLKDQRFINNKRLINALEFLAKTGKRGKFFRTDPRLAKIGKSEKEGMEAMVKAIIDIKPGDFANMEREVMDNTDVMEASMAVRGEDFFRSAGKIKGGALARQHTMKKVYSKWVDTQKGKKGFNIKNNAKNQEGFFKYLAEKYHVATPGIEKAQKNPRFTALGYDENLKYMTEEKRRIQPGTISVGSTLFEDKIKEEVDALRRMGERTRATQEKGERNIPRAGAEGKKKKNIPRTGKEGKK